MKRLANDSWKRKGAKPNELLTKLDKTNTVPFYNTSTYNGKSVWQAVRQNKWQSITPVHRATEHQFGSNVG